MVFYFKAAVGRSLIGQYNSSKIQLPSLLAALMALAKPSRKCSPERSLLLPHGQFIFGMFGLSGRGLVVIQSGFLPRFGSASRPAGLTIIVG